MVDSKDPIHFRSDDAPWSDYSAWYPDEMMRSMRAKRLIGPGGGIESDKTLFGLLEIDPGGYYPPHRHPAAEVYFVLSGRAECRWGDEIFTAEPGSVIRTQPNMVHSFRNVGDEAFRAVAYWYSENGDNAELGAGLELVEESESPSGRESPIPR